MNQAWVFVWLAGEPAHATEQEHLQAWAASKRVELVAPAPNRYDAGLGSIGAIGAHIEDLLERARVAKDSLDHAAAEALVTEAERSLAAHPELPQAPWLMAEASSVAATLAASAGELERARQHAKAASILEGPRSGGVSSEWDAAPGLERGDTPEGAPTSRERSVSGLRPGDVLIWNGEPLAVADGDEWPMTLEPGRHHARVLRGRHAPWSGWVDVSSATEEIELPVPEPVPCSEDDLLPVLSAAGGSTAVGCDRWVAVRPVTAGPGATTPGTIEIAWCHRSQCGSFERWPKATAPRQALSAAPPEDGSAGVPWWGYALLGTAVSATAAILILSVTNRERQERPVWIYGGVQ